jgi:hypothetical protein
MIIHVFVAITRGNSSYKSPYVNTTDMTIPRSYYVDSRKHSLPQIRVHLSEGVVERDAGKCTGESVAYLRGLIKYRSQLAKDDIIIFRHHHTKKEWHMPDPWNEQLGRLFSSGYASQPFGAVYCMFNTRFGGVRSDLNRTWKDLWLLPFHDTKWETLRPSSHQLFYPCCGTFFVHGYHVLQHSDDEYSAVINNLIHACHTTKLFTENEKRSKPGPLGNVMEGAWLPMLTGQRSVNLPPYCA